MLKQQEAIGTPMLQYPGIRGITREKIQMDWVAVFRAVFTSESPIIKSLSLQYLRLRRLAPFTVNHHRRLPSTVTLHQAVGDSPSLARLTQLVRESNQRLKAIEALIPSGLRPAVKAGPIDGENWCLLVSGNAAAAKIRQLIPLVQASLLRQGWKVTTIRLKILFANKR